MHYSFRFGHRIELLHHAQRIHFIPRLDDFAIFETVNTDAGNYHRLACRRNAHEFTLMSLPNGEAGHDLIVFRDLTFDSEGQSVTSTLSCGAGWMHLSKGWNSIQKALRERAAFLRIHMLVLE